MAVKFYSHEFKLFLVGILALLSVYYLPQYYLPIRIKVLGLLCNYLLEIVLNLILYSLGISLVTYWLFKGDEPGKYYIIWYWAIFINYYFLHVYLLPYNVYLGVLSALLFSAFPTITMWAVRIKRPPVDSLPTSQLWAGSVMFSVVILLSLYTGVEIKEFLYLSAVGLLLSFFAVGTEAKMVNLSLIPMLAIAFYYTYQVILDTTVCTALLLFAVSFLVFLASMKPAFGVDVMTGEITPIGVVTSRYFSLMLPVVITLAWYFIYELAKVFIPGYISPVNVEDFPLVFLPIIVGNVVVDYLRGREFDKYYVTGIIGGVGMADGLWLDLVGVLTYYLTVDNFGFIHGTIIYFIYVIPIVVILTRLA
ncbi:hypothetical protein [Acidianus sp. HS-5]|uniref:hypothetical protein n=1 Tax=Acidianus sp. HS-5 TaxID=2886040 RepID=UPI001F371B74|nr:hypothetical protein [Acidianus sp. HS-5]BDC17488.1 hypothetical protein HS5_03780 [Acidianus sp. HS-5]